MEKKKRRRVIKKDLIGVLNRKGELAPKENRKIKLAPKNNPSTILSNRKLRQTQKGD